VDFRLLTQGERVAAVSGAALFVFLFVSWLEGRTAWELFSLIDVLLAMIALLAVLLPLLKATGSDPPLRVSTGAVLSRAGLVALTITATFLIEGQERDVGIFLAVLASLALLYGGVTTRDEVGERRARRERPRRSFTAEDLEHPPPGMESWRARSWATDEFEEEPSPRRGAETASASEGAAASDEPFAEDEAPARRERRARERDAGERPPRPASEPTEVRRPRSRPEREPGDS
jgi:hypothetical protein